MEPDIVRVDRFDVDPNNCPLHAPITVNLLYTLTVPVPNATWSVSYEADFTNKKQAIPIFTSPPYSLEPGQHVFQHHCETINTDGVKEKYLLQVGLLKLTLQSGGDNVTSINCVTQVFKDPSGVLLRNIINPLE